MRILPIFSIVVLAGALAGCSKVEATATPTEGAPDAVTVKNAPIRHSPDASAAPGAGYRITPSNPNDPKFKMDPKLAGGN